MPRDILLGSWAELEAAKIPCLVLGDLHDGNVMVRSDTLELAGFLDTDRALWADPLREYYFRSVAAVSESWRAAVYREAGAMPPNEVPGSARRPALYDLYLGLVLVIESTYRGCGSDHESWVSGLLDDALALCEATRTRV